MIVLPLGIVPPELALASQVPLTLVTIVAFVVITELLAIVLIAITGCLQSQDEVLIAFVEEALGVGVPLIRRYIPDST